MTGEHDEGLEPLRLLLVEDSESDMLLLLHGLTSGGFDVSYRRVDTIAALTEALDDDWQLVVSDYSLPTMTAHDVVETVTANRPYLPCIVVSGTISEEAAVDLLKAGARDFVLKGHAYRLVPAIHRELREAEQRKRQREAEAALNETRERMRFVLEALSVGTWEADIASGALHWSDVMERLHGLAFGTFGGTFEDFVATVHPDDQEPVRRQVDQALQARTDSRVVYRTIWPDGSEHWLVGIGRVFCDAEGVPRRAVGMQMDVTNQRVVEDQLRQAQKMESIGNLASGIAHDFNNLLTVIGGYREVAAMALPPAHPATEALEGIGAAVTSAAALTAQLLTFSRRQIVTPRLVDLNEMLTGFAGILRRLVEESVRIDLVLAPSLPMVQIDPSQLEQVVLNLVVNARDAMPTGGTVTIATSRTSLDADQARRRLGVAPGEYVVLTVTDTGSGMPPEVQAQIFEPFYTTKPRGQGTGLGLSTVYGILKSCGGHIDVHSAPGAGTSFTLHLPATATARTTAQEQVSDAADLSGHETILVVEDNPPLRRLMANMLERYGYTVLLAGGRRQAQQTCEQHVGPIDVAILDVIMPDGSGPAVAEWITRMRPDTRIIYVSGYTDESFDRQVVQNSGTPLLQKPYTGPQLALAVRRVLSQRDRSPSP